MVTNFRSIMGLIVTICIASGLVEFYFGEKLSKTAFSQSKFFSNNIETHYLEFPLTMHGKI